jgi:hypothetical protein
MLSTFAAYLGTHFIAYVLLLRHLPRFRMERGIFLYHFVPAMVTGLAGLAYALADRSQARFVELVLALSVHGIYSISLLELWSLAQGGYSLSVLREVARAEADGVKLTFSHLVRIGETKQRERTTGLERLGLVSQSDGRISLTRGGSRVALLLFCLLRWIDPGKNGSEAT